MACRSRTSVPQRSNPRRCARADACTRAPPRRIRRPRRSASAPSGRRSRSRREAPAQRPRSRRRPPAARCWRAPYGPAPEKHPRRAAPPAAGCSPCLGFASEARRAKAPAGPLARLDDRLLLLAACVARAPGGRAGCAEVAADIGEACPEPPRAALPADLGCGCCSHVAGSGDDQREHHRRRQHVQGSADSRHVATSRSPHGRCRASHNPFRAVKKRCGLLVVICAFVPSTLASCCRDLPGE